MGEDNTETRIDSALETVFYHTDRVRFIHWGRYSGAKSAVSLVVVIAVLAFVTGLSNLSQEVIALDGPLAPVVPFAESIARFGGVVLAFAFAIIVGGLNRRKRLAWYGGLITLPLAAIVPLITFQANDVPLLVAILLAIPLLFRTRAQFDRPLDLSSLQIASLSSIVGVLLYGSIGSYAIRDQFVEIETWSDSVYYVIVTIATVGYGDITPITTEARWFSLSVIIFGTGAFTAAIGALVIPTIEKRMAAAVGNMKSSELRLLEDHVLILGYGDVPDALIDRLGDEVDVVIVTDDSNVASEFRNAETNVLTGDPTDTDTLEAANIVMARSVVVATGDDAQNVLSVIAAKQAREEATVVAVANDPQHADKLDAVGADLVVNPTYIVGEVLGRSVLEESIADLESKFAPSGTASADEEAADRS